MFCIDRQRDGKSPACAENCPSGALKFGTRGELLKEAHARLDGKPALLCRTTSSASMRPAGRRCCTSPTCRSSLLGFRTDVTTRPIPAYTWDMMSKLPFVVGGLAVVLDRRIGGDAATQRPP